MKTYDQWSSRMKQLGKAEDQYSQAAYQGYVNNMNAPKPKPKPKPKPTPNSNGGGAVRPLPAPPPLKTNPTADLQNQVQQLHDAIEAQNNQIQSDIAKNTAEQAAEQKAKEAKKPKDASKALNSTLLTGTAGVQDKKKKRNFLQPIGG